MNAKEGVEAWRALIAECMKEEIVNRQRPWTYPFRGLDGYEAREGKRGRHGDSRGVCVSLTEQKMGWEGKSEVRWLTFEVMKGRWASEGLGGGGRR